MTSTDAQEDAPSFLSASPDQVERGVAREILRYLPVLNPQDTAAIAMVPVRPVLEAKDAEIERLRAATAEGVRAATTEQFEDVIRAAADEVVQGKLTEIEASVRTDERKRCAAHLRDAQMWAAANMIDPLGPLQGARAAGGTT